MKFKIGTIVFLEIPIIPNEHSSLGIIISKEQGKKYCEGDCDICHDGVKSFPVYFFDRDNDCPFEAYRELKEYKHEI